MLSILYVILTILGSIIGFTVAPLVDGIERKIRAKIQNRIGPPLIQTWLDIAKLLRKESLIPRTAKALFIIAPAIALAMNIAALPLLYYGAPNILGFYGDIILILYLVVGSSLILSLGAAASGNPYATIGFSRKISLLIACELVVALSIATAILKTGSLSLTEVILRTGIAPSMIIAGIALLIVTYIESLRLPFELTEAKPEIMGGIFVEYSGRLLAFAELSHILHRFVMTLLSLDILIAPLLKLVFGVSIMGVLMSFIILMLISILVLIVYGAIESLCGRTRIDRALIFTARLMILPIISLILASIGV